MDSTGTDSASPDDSSTAAPTAARDATPVTASTADPEQQLLAWLSGAAAGLQPGAAGPTAAGPGPTNAGPATAGASAAGPTAAGQTAAGPTAAGRGTAEAAAAALALAASGTQSTEDATGSSAPSTSSDAARTGALSTDPSQSVTALLSNTAPFHLAAASHSETPQQAAGVLQSPLGTSAWVEELGAQISWMANQGIGTASLQVSPAELGPIEVRIAVHGSEASVWFGAAQATTRAALEQALPQLRHLFASQGLALADAGVFREPPRGSARQAPARSLAPVAAVSELSSDTAETRATQRLGLLDLYA